MNKKQFIRRDIVRYRHFVRKGYAVFASLHREVLICTLSVATATHASAGAASLRPMPNDTVKAMTEREQTLGEVNVTGTRAPLANGKAVRMGTVMTSADIESAAATSATDLLKLAPAVDVRQRGPIGAQADVSIRGGNYEQVAVLLDGINVCDPQTGHNSFDFPVDPSQIERIEVIEGPAARIYGTQSLLGAINIITKLPQQTSASAVAEGGSYGYARAAARANVVNGQWNNSLSASYTRTDGYSRSQQGTLNADLSAAKAFYRGQWRGDDATVGWHAGISAKGYGANTFYSAAYDNQYERTLTATVAAYADATCGRLHLRPQIYWNRNNDRFELVRGSEELSPYNYHRSDVFGLSLNAHFDWAAGRTALGAEVRSEDLVSTTLGELLDNPVDISGTDQQYTYGLQRTNISFTLEHNLYVGPLTASAGVLATRNTWNGTGMGFYPGVDIGLSLGHGWRLFASWNSSLRLPSATELYYSVGGYEADKHLRPEKLRAAELGARYDRGGFSARAAVYHNRYTDMIDWTRRTDEGADAPWQSVNFTKINATGVETAIRADFTRLTPSLAWLRSAGVSYCYIDQSKAAEENVESRYALEYLRHKLVADVQLRPLAKLTLGINCRWQDRTGTYTDTDGLTQYYRPYATLDAKATWSEAKWRVYVEANNITDKTYVDQGNVPQPGAWFIVGLAIDFMGRN